MNWPKTIAEISLANPIKIPAGSYHSFFIHSSLGLKYTDGTLEDRIYTQNADLIFYEGKGTDADFEGNL